MRLFPNGHDIKMNEVDLGVLMMSRKKKSRSSSITLSVIYLIICKGEETLWNRTMYKCLTIGIYSSDHYE